VLVGARVSQCAVRAVSLVAVNYRTSAVVILVTSG